MPAWVSEWLPVAPWLVAIAILAFVVVKLWPFVVKFVRFMDDVAGEPARPGYPARPGLMERVATIEHEVKTNHGSSLKDAVKRIELSQAEHRAENVAKFQTVEERLNELSEVDDELRDDIERTRNPWEEKQ